MMKGIILTDLERESGGDPRRKFKPQKSSIPLSSPASGRGSIQGPTPSPGAVSQPLSTCSTPWGVTSCFVEFIGAMLASPALSAPLSKRPTTRDTPPMHAVIHRSVSRRGHQRHDAGAGISDRNDQSLQRRDWPSWKTLPVALAGNSSFFTYRRMIRPAMFDFSPSRCGRWLHSRRGSPAGNWTTICSAKPWKIQTGPADHEGDL